MAHRSHLAATVPATLSRVITLSELAAFSADRPPGRLNTRGVPSLEVRWILPGELATAMAGWFGRFAAETKALEDSYLVDPVLPGLSV